MTTLEQRAIATIQPNPLNPRGPVDETDPTIRELADSMRERGVIQPLVLTPAGVLIAGHRRHVAARLARLQTVPVLYRDETEDEQLALMLIENMQRQALTAIQEARAFQRLIDSGTPQSEVARRVGLPVHAIGERTVLLRLAPAVQAMYERDELPVTLGRVLLTVSDPARQARIARSVAEQGMTVKQAQALAERGDAIAAAPKLITPTRGRPKGSGGEPPRKTAMALLAKRPDHAVTFTRVMGVMEAVCTACGQEDSPACGPCPLCVFVTLLAREPAKAGGVHAK